MAKLSETYKLKTNNNLAEIGGGNSAPVSYGGKLSETYKLGANTYQAPHVEFQKTIPSLSTSTQTTTPTPEIPAVQTKASNSLWDSIKNVFTGNAPKASTGIATSNTLNVLDSAKTKADTKKYQQNIRNNELANFDAKDKSEVIFTGKNGNKVTRDKLNLWLQSDYNLSGDEKKQVKELVNEMTNVKNYKKYFGNVSDAGKLYQDISRLEQRTKGALGAGFAEAIPGVKAVENLAASAIDKANGNTNTSDMLKSDRESLEKNKAYQAGRAGSKVLQYLGLNASGVLDPINAKLGSALIPKLGETLGGHVANILSDEVADVILDTVPETYENIKKGMSAEEVGKNVLKNLGVNLAYNVGGEAIPSLVKSFKKQGKEITEDTAKAILENPAEVGEKVIQRVNGPTQIEREAEALRQARTVDTIPTIEPTEIEKEAEALRRAKTVEQIPTIKGAEEATEIIPDVAKNTTPDVPKVYNAEKVSDEALNKRLNDHFNMFAKNDEGNALKAELKSALNEYEETMSPEAYDKLVSLSKQAESMMEGKTYRWKRDAGKRSGKVRQTSYPNSRGTITENVMSFIDSIKGMDEIVNQTNEAYREQISNIADVLKKNNANEYAWDSLNEIKKSLDEFVESGDEAVLENAISAVDDLTKTANIKYTDIQKDFEESIENAVYENVKNNMGKVMAEDVGLNDEISELIAPVEIKADAPKIPENVELPTLEKEVGPTSRFWEGGTTTTVTDPEIYEKAYKPMEEYNKVLQKPDAFVEDVASARLFTNGKVDPTKIDTWRKSLSLAENLTKEDMATAFEVKAFLEENNMLEEAGDFWSRIRPHVTNDAQVMQYLGSLKKRTLEGSLEAELGKIRKATDKKVGKKGFTDAVDNFARQVEDTINSGDVGSVAGMFEKNLSDFAYGKDAKNALKKTKADGEQMVLKLIGGYEPNKKTLKELAEEAGSVIRKANKVADITTKDEVAVRNLLEKASEYEVNTREFKELQAKAAKIIDQKIPVSLGDKIKTTLYDNMLGNFKTAVTRNAGGNLVSNALEKAQKPLKVAIDKAVSKITGERNYILDKDVAKAYGEGMKKGLKDQALDFARKTNTTRSAEESFADALANVKTAYKGNNAVSKVLGEYDRIVKGAMQFGDRPFYEAEFNAAKTELKKIVDKFGEDALTSVGVPTEALGNIDETIEFLARGRALEACFQKGTLSADGFKQLKEGLGNVSRGVVGADVLSQFSMPFIQVPANMMERMADYIPGLGTVKNIAQTIGETKLGGGLNQRRLVDATSRNLTGLGLFAGGVALANNANNGGAGITGGYSDDYDKSAVEKAAGEQEYAIQFPNGYQMDIRDLPTLGPMAQASSKFAEALRDNKGDFGKGLAEGGKQAISSAFETSALQGLNRMFGTSQYGNGGFGENVASVLGSGLGQAVPSLVRQTTQVADPYKRDLGEYNTPQYWLNNVINSTPLRQSMLNPKLDYEGNYIEESQGRGVGSKILEDMILPWKITNPEYSKLGEAANEVYEKTSDNSTKAYPTVPSRSQAKKWLGDKYDDQAYYELKERAGTLNTRIGGYVVGTRFYKDLPADDKAEVMSAVYTAINAMVRERAERGYESKNKLAEIYKKNGVKGMMEYLEKKYTKEIPSLK